MEILTASDVKVDADRIVNIILEGKLFIHPTDTIYGIGCNATNEKAVDQLRATKRQNVRPLSIIAPSIEWVRENCLITPKAEEWLQKLPGPYTLIMELKETSNLAFGVNFGNGTIGVRIPDNWFTDIIAKAGVPTITTSANITGENFMTSYDNLDSLVAMNCAFMVDEGIKKGKPSTIVDLTSHEISIKERE